MSDQASSQYQRCAFAFEGCLFTQYPFWEVFIYISRYTIGLHHVIITIICLFVVSRAFLFEYLRNHSLLSPSCFHEVRPLEGYKNDKTSIFQIVLQEKRGKTPPFLYPRLIQKGLNCPFPSVHLCVRPSLKISETSH